MKNHIKLLLILLFSTSIFSCTPLKDIIYLQEDIETLNNMVSEKPSEYLIKANDNLFVQIITDNELVTKLFNLSGGERQQISSDASIELISYKVSDGGLLNLPYIGSLKVSGLSIEEVNKLIQQEVDKQVDGASVTTKLVNRQFTILGEVNQPGTFSFYKNRITLFEALGYAGDISDYGNRHNVKHIRQVGSEKIVTELDLTDGSFLASEHFYIMPNDIIYIEPIHKVLGTKTVNVSNVTSAVLAVVTIINVISQLSTR